MSAIAERLKRWDILDEAIMRHGFTEYNRDYLLDVAFVNMGTVRFLFRGCVEAHYENFVVPTAYPTFMGDRFIDYHTWEEAGHPEGFVWGVNEADAYPGWRYIENSEPAALWSHRLNLPMHEVHIDTNTYRLCLVFPDLVVQPLHGAEAKS